MRYQVERREQAASVRVISEAGDAWAGETFVGSIVDDPEHGPLAVCGRVRMDGRDRTLKLKVEGKPDLIAALEEAARLTTEIKAAQRARTKAMQARGKRVLKVAAQHGMDLCWAVEGAGEGEHIGIPDTDRVEVKRETPTVTAVLRRAPCGWFHGCENYLIAVTQDEWATIVAELSAAREQQRATTAARNAQLLAVDVPADAVAAYRQCAGDPERLPDDIDNPGYWLVKKYADAIEEQGLATDASLTKFAREARAAARETPSLED